MEDCHQNCDCASGKLLCPKVLSVLRLNQAVYNEIASRLYDTLDVHISPFYDEPWVLIRYRQLRVSWVISHEDNNDGQQELSKFPYDKVKLVVHVYTPNPEYLGQIILLWQKVQSRRGPEPWTSQNPGDSFARAPRDRLATGKKGRREHQISHTVIFPTIKSSFHHFVVYAGGWER